MTNKLVEVENLDLCIHLKHSPKPLPFTLIIIITLLYRRHNNNQMVK